MSFIVPDNYFHLRIDKICYGMLAKKYNQFLINSKYTLTVR